MQWPCLQPTFSDSDATGVSTVSSVAQPHSLKDKLLAALRHSSTVTTTDFSEPSPSLGKEATQTKTSVTVPEAFDVQPHAKPHVSGKLGGTFDRFVETVESNSEKELPTLTISNQRNHIISNETAVSGGIMSDLTGYKDLSKSPVSYGDDLDKESNAFTRPDSDFDRAGNISDQITTLDLDVDTEFSGNVKTLIRLVNDLPEGVTKQTGAQIIRLTMEAMGISMEDVLTEAQSAQSEMLDAVRANIKKIEEYKTVIRKLETDIKYYQGKANELSEIIDLFILSNTSSSNSPELEDLDDE